MGATPESLAKKLPMSLGLQGIRERVRLLNGEVTIHTRKKGGFRLGVRMPAQPPHSPGRHCDHGHAGGRPHPVARGLRRLLEHAGDISVEGEAGNGAEALALLAQRPWDLLVLDMSMPGRDGVDLIRQIRGEHPKLPILVLTMHGEQQYAVRAIKAGAAGYLTTAPPRNWWRRCARWPAAVAT